MCQKDEGYHVWGFLWTEDYMKIYYDGIFKVQYATDRWVVRANEYLWLSDGAAFGEEGDEYFVNRPLGHLSGKIYTFLKDKLVVKASSPVCIYQLYELFGNCLQHIRLGECRFSYEVDTSGLSSGIYIERHV